MSPIGHEPCVRVYCHCEDSEKQRKHTVVAMCTLRETRNVENTENIENSVCRRCEDNEKQTVVVHVQNSPGEIYNWRSDVRARCCYIYIYIYVYIYIYTHSYICTITLYTLDVSI